jgi:hypothetical protein
MSLEDDATCKANPIIRANCLILIAEIFNAQPRNLPQQAGIILGHLLSNPGRRSPLAECLHVIRSAVEQLSTQALFFFDPLFDLLASVVQEASFVEMDPAFQTLSSLCVQFPGEMARRIPTTPHLLEPCFHPEAFARARDGGFLLALAGFLRSSPVDFPLEIYSAFLEMCTAACEIAFGAPRRDHDERPEGQPEDDDGPEEEQEDESQVIEILYESIIVGFATLIFIARNNWSFLEYRVPRWTLTAEKLVLHHQPAAPARILAAYFTLLETSRKHYPPSQQLIGELQLVPLSWGIASIDLDLWARAATLWQHFRAWYSTHS